MQTQKTMAMLLIPIFFISLAYAVFGVFQVKNKVTRGFMVLAGLPILVIGYPLVMHIINGMLGGFIETRMSPLWDTVELLTIEDGDIYMGAGGLILVVISTTMLVLQILLARSNKSV